MKPICQVFWKDVRRQRWLLGAWLLVLLVQAAIDLLYLTPADSSRLVSFYFFRDSSLWLTVVVGLGLALLAALAVQEDLPHGDRRFWLTRPVSKGQMLAAKLMFLLGLVLLQTAVHLAVFARAGLGVRDLFYAGAEDMLEAGALALAFAGLSVLAGSPMRFVLSTLAILIGASGAALMLFSRHIGLVGPVEVPEPLRTEGLNASLVIAMMLWAGLAGLGMLGWRYLVRHSSRSWLGPVLAWLATLVLFAAPSQWRWDFFPLAPDDSIQTPPGSPVRFELVDSTLVPTGAGGTYGAMFGAAVGGVRLSDGRWAIPEMSTQADLTWRSTGTRVSWNSPLFSLSNDAGSLLARDVLADAMAPLRLLDVGTRKYYQLALIQLGQDKEARLQREPAALQVRFRAVRVSYRVGAPLVVGAGFTEQPDGIRVALTGRWTGTNFREDNPRVNGADGERFALRSVRFAALLRGAFSKEYRPISGGLLRQPQVVRPETARPFREVYLAVNRTAGTAVVAVGVDNYPIEVRGLRVKRRTLLVPFVDQSAGEKGIVERQTPAPSREWLRDAEFIRIGIVRQGTLPGELDAEGVRLSQSAVR